MEESERTRVVIFTNRFRIVGQIDLFPNARLTDFMLDAKPFIAVTDVKVYTLDGKPVLAAGFCDVRKDEVVVVTTEDTIQKQ